MPNLFLSGLMSASSAKEAMHQSERLRQANQTAMIAKTDAQELRNHVERLCLLNQAMWELVSEKLLLTEEELMRKAQEVDLRDGKADGKMTDHPLQCPKCARVSNSRHKQCLYCGLEFEGSLFG